MVEPESCGMDGLSLHSERDRAALEGIAEKLTRVAAVLAASPRPDAASPAGLWLEALTQLKAVVGNNSDDLAFIGRLLAKEYLRRLFSIEDYDAASKPRNTRGLPLDVQTTSGERVIAEIKTTTPFYESNLGEKQREVFDRDFGRLNATAADHKFFFITDPRLYEIVTTRYAHLIPAAVRVIRLP